MGAQILQQRMYNKSGHRILVDTDFNKTDKLINIIRRGLLAEELLPSINED